MKSIQYLNFKRKRPTLGVLAGWQVHTGTPDSFLHQVFRGIHAAARDQDCNLLLAYSIGSPRGMSSGRQAWPMLIEEADFVPVGPWNVDGLIIAPPILSPSKGAQYFQTLQSQGYPIVSAGSGLPGPSVVPDNEYGIRQAMEHLVAHGHRRIAFVAGHSCRLEGDSGSRLGTYQAFLEEHGLEQHPALIAYSDHTAIGGRRAMTQILNSEVPFSAVVASNDLAAVGVWEVLHEAKLSVPEDVALIGFDDRVEARALAPQLTTVHYPIFEVGYQAVLLLLQYLRGQVEGNVTLRVPTRLVVRESCGCLPGEMLYLPAGRLSSAASSRAHSSLPPNAAPDKTSVIETLTEVVFNETHRLNLSEVRALCARLVTACCDSLRQGETHTFRRSVQQILEHVVAHEDGLQGWQAGISALREQMPVLQTSALAKNAPKGNEAVCLSEREIEDMLHQARIAISGMAQGQQARYLIRQAEIANQISQTTARFHAVQDEEEIFTTLAENLPTVGIRHATVAFYEPEDEDPVAWSVLRGVPAGATDYPERFPSRTFPPDGLYAEDEPFCLAVLPLLFQKQVTGFIAFDTGNLDLCAEIAWQLVAALRGVQLYRAAVEGQRLAEEANRLKSRFLSMVSHELRAPLNLISGLSDLLLREAGGELLNASNGMREDLERIYVNAQHLDGLIRDVLDLARSEVGQLHLTYEPLDMHEVLEPISVIARQLVREKSLTWRTEIPADLPYVLGDRTRLRQVVLNLVNNAVKFTARGEIVLRAAVQDETVRVSVQDTGLGIPREEQSVIFDEFRQSERTTARGYGGLGLGLAICKRLIELHGGKIDVHSSGEEEAGSEFYFTLPITQPVPPADRERTLEASQRVLLLVCDIKEGRTLQQHWLQKGFEVILQSVMGQNGEWLTDVIAMSPHVVLLDQNATAEKGWEILKALKPVSYTHLTLPTKRIV